MGSASLAEELARAMSANLRLDPPVTPVGADWETVAASARDVCARAQALSPNLIFEYPPRSILQQYQRDSENSLCLAWLTSAPVSASPNTGPFSLKPENYPTKSYMMIETMLWTLINTINDKTSPPPDQIKLDIEKAAETLDDLKSQAWKTCIRALGEETITSPSGTPIFRNTREREFSIIMTVATPLTC